MTKQSPLSDFHKSNGASFQEFYGWLLPDHFGDFMAEYQAVRTAAGLIDLTHRGLLQITGPDRASYLQGMVSNDLRTLHPYQGQYATILNQQGKVLGDLRILCSENSFYLELWEALKDKIAEHLNRYLVADEVEIADRTASYGVLSVQGPRSAALLQKYFGQAQLPALPLGHAMVGGAGAKLCVVRDSHTGEEGFDLIVAKAQIGDVARQLTESAIHFSASWVGEKAQDILRIEAGIPRYGIDFSEDNLLLEVGIDHAVSFTKGCYLGQEVVERIRSRGHVNKKLVGLILDGGEAARPGSAIFAGGGAAGTITSSVFSPSLARPIALGYVAKDWLAPGTRVHVQRDNAATAATVTTLPFVVPEAGKGT